MPHFPLAQVTYKEPPLKGPDNIFWLSFLLFERAHTAVTVAIRGNVDDWISTFAEPRVWARGTRDT